MSPGTQKLENDVSIKLYNVQSQNQKLPNCTAILLGTPVSVTKLKRRLTFLFLFPLRFKMINFLRMYLFKYNHHDNYDRHTPKTHFSFVHGDNIHVVVKNQKL